MLQTEAARHGDRLAAISVDRLMDVKAGFDARGIDTTPFFTFAPPDDLGFPARSVLVVASPSPPAAATFHVHGEWRTVVIPPRQTHE